MKTGDELDQELRALAELSTSDGGQERLWPTFDRNFSECDLRSRLVASTFRADRSEWRDAYADELPHLETDDVYLAFWWGVGDNEPEVFRIERDDYIAKDMFLLIAVVVAALLLIVVQVRSIFLGLAGVFAIVLATVAAICLYRVFVSNWFGILNTFSFFLLLGIACDDIFVLADAWRLATESGGIAPDDYRGRLRYMLPRAGGAVTTTSLTTAGAFFGNAISIIPPTRLFGIFSGCMVLADWVITVSLMPALFVLQHRWFGGAWCERREASEAGAQPRLIDRLLARKFAPGVLRFAPALLIAMAAITATSFNVALEMKPAAEWHNSDLLPSSYNQPRAHRAQQAMKNLQPEYGFLWVVYGVVPEDTGDMDDPQSKSDVTWGDPVDITAPAVQEFVRDLCKDLLANRGLVRNLYRCWALNAEAVAAERGIAFPIEDARLFEEEFWRWEGAELMPDGSGYWFFVDVELTLKTDESVSATRQAYDEWEALMEHWNGEAKRRGLRGLSQGFQFCGRWRFMSTIEAMANTAIVACCISTFIAAVLLLITMRNLIVVPVIIANVVAVCLSLVACLVIEGRGLGVLEGISMTLIVGLSVDYLVHIATAYLDASRSMSRGQRSLHAMAHLGGSVFAAAGTTILSAVFLCVGTITFNVSFGRFVIGMMAFSMLFTFFSLVPFLHLFGPERGVGDIRCFRSGGGEVQSSLEEREDSALTSGVQIPPVSARTRLVVAVSVVLILLVGGVVRIAVTLSRDSDDDSATCGAPTELDFTFEQFAVPPQKDSYRCRDYDLVPAGCTYYVTGWEPIVADGMAPFVHHMILFSTQRAVSQCTFTCFDMPDAIGTDAAWAVGGGDLSFPDGMALAVGGTKHALQIHYYNPLVQSGVVDARSGLKLRLSQNPPATTIVTMFIGLHPRGDLYIPAGMANRTVFVECAPQLRGDVQVVAYTPHAHKLGFRIVTELRRPVSSGSRSKISVGDVGSSLWFDFNYQTVHKLEATAYRTIKPGDSVRIYCSYNSLGRTSDTFSGHGSEDEMCLTALYLEPAGNVVNTGCWEYRSEPVFE